MQRTQKEEKKVKNILYAKRSWLCDSEVDSQEKQENYQAHFLKYFPKYIESIQLQGFDGPTLTKLKRTKIIHKVHSLLPKKKMILQSRSFLANKTKTVQKYYNLKEPKEITEALKRFPLLQILSLSSITESEKPFQWPIIVKTPEALKKEIEDFCQVIKYIKRMSQLQSLEIMFNKKEFVRVLRELDSYKRLKDLKHLAIKFKWKNSADQIILKDLIFEAKNLFHYMTYLNLGRFIQDGCEGFKELPEKCLNLQRMSVRVDNCSYSNVGGWENTGNPEPITSNYLQSFGSFQKLERIRVEVGDLETFFRDFALPISTKSVEIWFFKNGGSIFSAAPITRSLKEDVKSSDFYERWSKLENLESLDMLDSDVDFAQELLKNVPQLKELKLRSAKLLQEVEVFDLVSFFEPLEHINKELEVLEIEPIKPFSMKEDSIKDIRFSKLRRLILKGEWEKNELRSYLGLFKNNSVGGGDRVIEFVDKLYGPSENFFKLLGQLSSIEKAEDELEMAFTLLVEISDNKKDVEAFIKRLEEFTQRSKEMKNVSLHLESYAFVFKGKLDKFMDFGKLFKKFDYTSCENYL